MKTSAIAALICSPLTLYESMVPRPVFDLQWAEGDTTSKPGKDVIVDAESGR